MNKRRTAAVYSFAGESRTSSRYHNEIITQTRMFPPSNVYWISGEICVLSGMVQRYPKNSNCKNIFEGESSNRNSRQTAVDCRRSTAAQFFLEEKLQETVSADRVAQTLRDASLSKR
ncbi:symplekin [Trichonephila clavipes]|nr:symplekin [Trichonephila clavipes]